jgi:hypothetical protein
MQAINHVKSFFCAIRILVCLFVQLIQLKFKFLQNISHFYNNIFAFHKHVFIIYVLSFNNLNIIVRPHIIFIIIAYNHNLHFIIHCKKNKTPKVIVQFISSLSSTTKISHKLEHKIHYRSLWFSVLLKTSIPIIA